MKAEIAERIRLINKGQVPKGYKKSKVGIIPSDWEEKKLGDIADFKNGLNFLKSDEGFNYKMIGVSGFQDYSSPRDDSFEDISIKSELKNDELLKKDDLLFVRSNGNKALIGRCLYIDKELKSTSFSGFTIRGRVNDSDFDSYFISLFMRSHLVKKQFLIFGGGSNISNLSQDILNNIEIYKLKLPEQQKIASILSTWDKAIELKEKLISEKKKQKTSLMQELLTGKKRLDGFDGEWEEKKFLYFLEESSENVGDRYIVPVAVGVRGIRQRNEIYKKELSSDYSKNKVIRKDYLCFGIGSNEIVYDVLLEDSEYCVSPAYKVFKTKNISTYLLKIIVDTYKLKFSKNYMIISARQGKSVNFKGMLNEYIKIPSKKEEEILVNIFKTADKEISLLEKELQALKEQKKGLMQLLLTGIVRVN